MRNTMLLKLALVSALLNAGMVILGRGSWLHTVAVLFGGIYVGLPALFLGGCGYLTGYRKDVARIAVAVFVLTASLVISLIPGRVLVKHDIAAARAYCESLMPGIDRYRQ